ncbi:MAG TPA: flavin reductase family protein [Streptosporangiaceae bacterium]
MFDYRMREAASGRRGLRETVFGMRPEDGLRCCLGRFVTGVTVVTFACEGRSYGITVNAFTSVSLEPPIVLVSIARRARAHDLLRGRPFCVNVLGAEQEPYARAFSGGDTVVPQWHPPDDGPPRLAGTLAHLACRPWRAYDGGDHTLFLGEVTGYAYRDGDALAYANSRFTTVTEPTFGHEYLI